MSKGVIKTKPVANLAETSKPDPYANYTAGELADMIADTTGELQSAIRQLDDLNEVTQAYQDDLDNAYSRYQEEMEATKQHQEEKRKAEVRVQELSLNARMMWKVLAEGFTGKIGNRYNTFCDNM